MGLGMGYPKGAIRLEQRLEQDFKYWSIPVYQFTIGLVRTG